MALPSFAPGTPLPAASLNEVARQTVIPCASEAAQNAILAPHEGMTIYRSDIDVIRRWDGGAWRTVPSIQSGQASVGVNSLAAGASAEAAVVFPVPFGTNVVRVVATPASTSRAALVDVSAVSTTGFQLVVRNVGTSTWPSGLTMKANWIAVYGA